MLKIKATLEFLKIISELGPPHIVGPPHEKDHVRNMATSEIEPPQE